MHSYFIANSLKGLWVALAAPALALLLIPQASAQNAYLQHNLVSDLPGKADVTDTNLVNPWGIATSATSPFWVSDNHSGLSTLYNSTGGVSALVVKIPPPAGSDGPAAPTGMIFNGNSKNFLIGTNAAHFIFSTEDGTIAAWSSGSNAVLKVDNSAGNAIYKGLALASTGGSNLLYATDFHNGKVDVFDSSFQPVTLPGGFVDATLPLGYAPFNIQSIGGNLFVTYALQDDNKEDDVGGPGHGFINVFDTAGHFVKRFASNGVLNSPWGLAMAPQGFGQFSGALLVGNFGDGTINAFDPATGTSLGTLNDPTGNPLAIEGLWALKFGNGGQGGNLLTLYFTAGISGGGHVEDHGLFGSIAVNSSISLHVAGISTNGMQLQWTGGTAPYLLQRKLSASDTNWFDVLTTTNQSTIVAKDAANAYFRLLDHATQTVIPFTVWMSDAAEHPPLSTGATGFGIMSLEGNTVSYQIRFQGLSGPAQAAHIHGVADTTQDAAVITPLVAPAATSGILSGTADISNYTPDLLAALKSGKTYVNIHTAANPGGEMRGQVAPVNFTASLSGAGEVPAVNTSGAASAQLTLIGNELTWDVSYSGLSSGAIAAHIHGPASATDNAAVLFPIGNPTGTSGRLTGSQTLSAPELDELLDGQTYVNVHTTTNPGGEIRGQVTPK